MQVVPHPGFLFFEKVQLVFYISCLSGLVFVFECSQEEYSNHQRIGREGEPDVLPVFSSGCIREIVNNFTSK